MKRLFLSLLLLLILSPLSLAQQKYSYADLIQRLTDPELLAILPAPGERTALASSYDRASQYDPKTDTYIQWGANGDGGGIVRQEGNTIVMADIAGPGCIWRMWSATPMSGHVKIFLDGSPTPQIDLPFTRYFDRTWAPFDRPKLVYVTPASGFDNYTPIPFQKSCKIVADKNWGKYYQFTYSQFPAGTVVPTLTADLSPADSAALDQADHFLGEPGAASESPASKEKTETVSVQAAASAEATVIDLPGPQAITALKLKLDLPKDPQAQRLLLKQLTLSLTWDGQAQPAVWSPLGDFFGTVGGSAAHSSWPVGLKSDGTFYAFWYMPFAKSAHVSIKNESPDPVKMTWTVTHAPLNRPIESLGYFHAKWHRDAFLPTRSDRRPDWTLLQTQGTGRYVGTQLHVFQMRGPWWGEGDDKFFVDGEKFPSIFGTGSEDYFGYAWSSSKLFTEPFHGQALRDPGQMANISDYRYHIADNVPFQKSFEGAIEKYLANNRTIYAAVAYWYLSPAGTDPYGIVDVKDRTDYWLNPPSNDGYIVEGVEMSWDWSAPNHLRQITDEKVDADGYAGWTAPVQPGNSVKLTFHFDRSGKYKAIFRLVKNPQGGTYQLVLNDQKLGNPVDLYSATPSTAEEMDLGTVDVKPGPQTLSVTYTGSDPAMVRHWADFGWTVFVSSPLLDHSDNSDVANEPDQTIATTGAWFFTGD